MYKLIAFCIIVNLFCMAVFLFLYVKTGSAELALRYSNGERIFLKPEKVNLGACLANESKTINLTIHNYSTTSIKYSGSSSDCGCVNIKDAEHYGLTVESGEKKMLSISVATGEHEGSRQQSIILYFRNDKTFSLESKISWDVELSQRADN